MRNVILRYEFNSDSCFYLLKFLSRANGVLQEEAYYYRMQAWGHVFQQQ